MSETVLRTVVHFGPTLKPPLRLHVSPAEREESPDRLVGGRPLIGPWIGGPPLAQGGEPLIGFSTGGLPLATAGSHSSVTASVGSHSPGGGAWCGGTCWAGMEASTAPPLTLTGLTARRGLVQICYSIGVEFRIVEREKPTITIINKKIIIIINKKNFQQR